MAPEPVTPAVPVVHASDEGQVIDGRAALEQALSGEGAAADEMPPVGPTADDGGNAGSDEDEEGEGAETPPSTARAPQPERTVDEWAALLRQNPNTAKQIPTRLMAAVFDKRDQLVLDDEKRTVQARQQIETSISRFVAAESAHDFQTLAELEEEDPDGAYHYHLAKAQEAAKKPGSQISQQQEVAGRINTAVVRYWPDPVAFPRAEAEIRQMVDRGDFPQTEEGLQGLLIAIGEAKAREQAAPAPAAPAIVAAPGERRRTPVRHIGGVVGEGGALDAGQYDLHKPGQAKKLLEASLAET